MKILIRIGEHNNITFRMGFMLFELGQKKKSLAYGYHTWLIFYTDANISSMKIKIICGQTFL